MKARDQKNPLLRTIWSYTLGLRLWLAKRSRTTFSGLYSVLDTAEEVPVQVAAYQLATEQFIQEGDQILDVGFGLGYGLQIMSPKAASLSGIEVDRKALARARGSFDQGKIRDLLHYDGYAVPFAAGAFDVVTCVDVLEHVGDYERLLRDICRVSRRVVIISTPNRRAEYTNPDGTPMNPWHLREWTYGELDRIVRRLGVRHEWRFINGPWEGPFSITEQETETTMALVPILWPHGAEADKTQA